MNIYKIITLAIVLLMMAPFVIAQDAPIIEDGTPGSADIQPVDLDEREDPGLVVPGDEELGIVKEFDTPAPLVPGQTPGAGVYRAGDGYIGVDDAGNAQAFNNQGEEQGEPGPFDQIKDQLLQSAVGALTQPFQSALGSFFSKNPISAKMGDILKTPGLTDDNCAFDPVKDCVTTEEGGGGGGSTPTGAQVAAPGAPSEAGLGGQCQINAEPELTLTHIEQVCEKLGTAGVDHKPKTFEQGFCGNDAANTDLYQPTCVGSMLTTAQTKCALTLETTTQEIQEANKAAQKAMEEVQQSMQVATAGITAAGIAETCPGVTIEKSAYQQLQQKAQDLQQKAQKVMQAQGGKIARDDTNLMAQSSQQTKQQSQMADQNTAQIPSRIQPVMAQWCSQCGPQNPAACAKCSMCQAALSGVQGPVTQSQTANQQVTQADQQVQTGKENVMKLYEAAAKEGGFTDEATNAFNQCGGQSCGVQDTMTSKGITDKDAKLPTEECDSCVARRLNLPGNFDAAANLVKPDQIIGDLLKEQLGPGAGESSNPPPQPSQGMPGYCGDGSCTESDRTYCPTDCVITLEYNTCGDGHCGSNEPHTCPQDCRPAIIDSFDIVTGGAAVTTGAAGPCKDNLNKDLDQAMKDKGQAEAKNPTFENNPTGTQEKLGGAVKDGAATNTGQSGQDNSFFKGMGKQLFQQFTGAVMGGLGQALVGQLTGGDDKGGDSGGGAAPSSGTTGPPPQVQTTGPPDIAAIPGDVDPPSAELAENCKLSGATCVGSGQCTGTETTGKDCENDLPVCCSMGVPEITPVTPPALDYDPAVLYATQVEERGAEAAKLIWETQNEMISNPITGNLHGTILYEDGNIQDLADTAVNTDQVGVASIHVINNRNVMFTLEDGNRGVKNNGQGTFKISHQGTTAMTVARRGGSMILAPQNKLITILMGQHIYEGKSDTYTTNTGVFSLSDGVFAFVPEDCGVHDTGFMRLTNLGIFTPVLPLMDLTFNKGKTPTAMNAIDITTESTKGVLLGKGCTDIFTVARSGAFPFHFRKAAKGSSHIIYFKDQKIDKRYNVKDDDGKGYTIERDLSVVSQSTGKTIQSGFGLPVSQSDFTPKARSLIYEQR